MPLSPHELRALTRIEQQLGSDDPELAAALRRGPQGRRPRPVRPEVPYWAGQLWVLVLLLGALALHPLLVPLGVLGIGLLTVALVLPWLLNAARCGSRGGARARDDTDRPR